MQLYTGVYCQRFNPEFVWQVRCRARSVFHPVVMAIGRFPGLGLTRVNPRSSWVNPSGHRAFPRVRVNPG